MKKMPKDLAQAMNDAVVRRLAGAKFYQRGLDYFSHGHVESLEGRDNALLWAEKGLKAFPDHTDGRLREFAAEEYHRRRRHDDAMKLMWAEFSERPYLETYKTLERHAKKAGEWPGWRERALAEIRLRIAKAKEKARG
jgi:uncharacterized Zn finger protein